MTLRSDFESEELQVVFLGFSIYPCGFNTHNNGSFTTVSMTGNSVDLKTRPDFEEISNF